MRRKVGLLLITCICLCMIITPTISAPYIFDKNESSPNVSLVTQETIVPGDEKVYRYHVSSDSENLEIEVVWMKSWEQSIRLQMISPSSRMFGCYVDETDGKIDGRIPIKLSSRHLDRGDWHIKVCGAKISEPLEFTLTINDY